MEFTRKEFLVISACIPCLCMSKETNPGISERKVNAGPISNYALAGSYDKFRDQGFFVVRRGDKIFALSAICTHRRCKLTVSADYSYYCDCHGSTFDPNGRVTEGPATRDLPVLQSYIDEHGSLIVLVR